MPRTTDTAVPPADVARARRSRLSWLVDVSCWLAICVFLLGSFRYRGTFDGKRAVLEMGDWGFALVPMLFALAWGGRAALRGTWTVRFLGFTWRQVTRAGENHPWRLWSMLFLPWGVVQLRAVLARYWSFNADWDLAIYAQACSHNLYSSRGGETMLLADHFEPVLGIFAPLCRVTDPSAALLTVQTAALFAGAAGFAQLCRQQRWSWPSALVGAFLYTSFSGMRTVLFYDFHLVVLAVALTPWLFVSLTARRWGWAACGGTESEYFAAY